jgi:hypothetical protein
MTDELVFAEVPHPGDQAGIREWAVRGPGGAVNFLTKGATGLVIGIHSPAVPGSDGLASPCDLLDGGLCTQDVTYLGAAELEERWQAAGGGEAVIRAALETWYASRLAPGGELA